MFRSCVCYVVWLLRLFVPFIFFHFSSPSSFSVLYSLCLFLLFVWFWMKKVLSLLGGFPPCSLLPTFEESWRHHIRRLEPLCQITLQGVINNTITAFSLSLSLSPSLLCNWQNGNERNKVEHLTLARMRQISQVWVSLLTFVINGERFVLHAGIGSIRVFFISLSLSVPFLWKPFFFPFKIFCEKSHFSEQTSLFFSETFPEDAIYEYY